MNAHRFSIVSGTFSIVRLQVGHDVPAWALDASGFVSITRTSDELSIVCPESDAPSDVHCERGWAIRKVLGPLPFAQTGVLASFASPLAASGISLFAVSTFDTDYILIEATQLSAACQALTAAGHELVE
jgi:hypothetical protein